MNDLERRTTFGLEVRGLDQQKPMISGYFSPFNSLSEPIGFGFKERMLPGAFNRSIRTNSDILALDWHQLNSCQAVIGSMRAGTARLREDSQGLYGEIEPPDTTVARDLVANMKAGNVKGASIGFRDVKGGIKWTQEDGWDVRSVSDLNLHEVSVTAMPAYKATALSARSLFGSTINNEHGNLICRALNRVENKLDIVDEDKAILSEYRSMLKNALPPQHRALVDKLLGPEREVMRPADVTLWVDSMEFVRDAKSGNKMPYGDVHYADPGYQADRKKRYPLDTAEHIKAAWDYIHHGNDKGQYTASQVEKIEAAIVDAWKQKIDPKGPPEADDK